MDKIGENINWEKKVGIKKRTNELWNAESNKEERNFFRHVSRRDSSLEIYNSAAVSKKRFAHWLFDLWTLL